MRANSPGFVFSLFLITFCGIASLFFDTVIIDKYFRRGLDNCGGVKRDELLQRWSQFPAGIKSEIFGQHIATDAVFRFIYAHLSEENPSKSLVISFHGWLGGGKTHLSSLIAQTLFEGGISSSNVKYLIGPKDFLPDPDQLRHNQKKLVDLVEKGLQTCSYTLFIFDEVDKMPRQVFDSLTPYIDYHGAIDGRDYRKLMFIFLSNNGGETINQITYDKISEWRKAREELELFDFREPLARGAFNEQGGLHKSEMISKVLISHYIPFLPLEYKHLLLCTKRELKIKNVLYVKPEQIVDKIMFSSGDPRFAQEGCKNIQSYVNYFVQESHFI